jgi:hypothetical protein
MPVFTTDGRSRRLTKAAGAQSRGKMLSSCFSQGCLSHSLGRGMCDLTFDESNNLSPRDHLQ